MTKTVFRLLALLAVLAAPLSAADPPADKTPPAEPEHIKVQHILISFEGKLPGKNITRSEPEAKKLAYEVLERARQGEDFDMLVKQYTDDAHPGIYGMANMEVAPNQGEFPRNKMVRAFGDVGFALKVGEIGISDFDPKTSPFGFHIIKRTE